MQDFFDTILISPSARSRDKVDFLVGELERTSLRGASNNSGVSRMHLNISTMEHTFIFMNAYYTQSSRFVTNVNEAITSERASETLACARVACACWLSL